MRGMRSEAVNDSEKIITMEENPYTNIMKSEIIPSGLRASFLATSPKPCISEFIGFPLCEEDSVRR